MKQLTEDTGYVVKGFTVSINKNLLPKWDKSGEQKGIENNVNWLILKNNNFSWRENENSTFI